MIFHMTMNVSELVPSSHIAQFLGTRRGAEQESASSLPTGQEAPLRPRSCGPPLYSMLTAATLSKSHIHCCKTHS